MATKDRPGRRELPREPVNDASERRFVDGIMEDAGRAPDAPTFRRWLVERLRPLVGFDTAVVVPQFEMGAALAPTAGDQSHTWINVGVEEPIFGHYFRNQPRYAAQMGRLVGAMAGGGLVVPRDVYSSSEWSRLAVFAEVLSPLGICSTSAADLSFRGHITGVLTLNRHGRGSAFDAADSRRVRRALAVAGMADAAVLAQCGAKGGEGLLASLTGRELQVARLIRAGLQNKEIAAVLGTSVETVRKQTISVYGKLGVAGRIALVLRFGDALGGEP
jgi:DNA-binding CsgD family transcriptional regulator